MDSLETAKVLGESGLVLVSYDNFVKQISYSLSCLDQVLFNLLEGACGYPREGLQPLTCFINPKVLSRQICFSDEENHKILEICDGKFRELERDCINVSHREL